MRFVPRSLAGRLGLLGAVSILLALLFGGSAIAFILSRFSVAQIDRQLEAQILAVTEALQEAPDGDVSLVRSVDSPPFDRPGSGWTWVVRGAGVSLRSASSKGETPLPAGRSSRPWLDENPFAGSRSPPPGGRGRPIDRGPLHWVSRETVLGNRSLLVAASAPREAIARPLREAMPPLILTILVLGLALTAASYWQVRLGLRPLAAMRRELEDIRAGRREALGTGQPVEVAPLASEVNLLLAENAAGLERARRHVANLAHGLKTPLAALSLSAERRGNEDREQIEIMDRLVRHHLTRARTAALSGLARASTPVESRLRDLRALFLTVHRDRNLNMSITAEPGLHAACEAQDLDEICGNILDNACKWARSNVSVHAVRAGAQIVLTVTDDGPGMPEGKLPDALRPGHRIDEAAPGYGFGLPIAIELAELYGGSVSLDRAEAGGLVVRIALPASA